MQSMRHRAVLVVVLAWAGTAHATALDGMFNHWATDTWYIGVPLGFSLVLCARQLKTAVEEKMWRALAYGILLLLLGAAFGIWVFLGMDDPWSLPITAATLIGSVALLFAWRLGERADER